MKMDMDREIRESKAAGDCRNEVDFQAEREALAISKLPNARLRVPSLARTPRLVGRSDWDYHGDGVH